MIIVFCTAPKNKSEEIAKILLEEKLVACVNISTQVKSMYWWNDQIQTDTEELMIIKTKKELFSELVTKITEIHPYDVPEIISFKIEEGNGEYLEWLTKSTK